MPVRHRPPARLSGLLVGLLACAVLTTGPSRADGIFLSQAVLAHSGEELVPQAMAANSFEIESSRLALHRARSARVRALAARLLRDHLRMQRELVAAARRDRIAPVAAPLDGTNQHRLDTLASAPEGTFDEAFVEIQVEAHVDSINLYSSYYTRGLDAALLRLTARTLPSLHARYTEAERLRERGVA